MAVKDTLAAFYETRVSLEDTKAWFKSLINMENRYFDSTSKYYSLRDQVHKAEYQSLKKTATDHIGDHPLKYKKWGNGRQIMSTFLMFQKTQFFLFSAK